MRAVIQGTDAVASWNRYLYSYKTPPSAPNSTDIAQVIRRIKDAFIVASKHHQCLGVQQIRRPRRSMSALSSTEPMTLENFVDEKNLENFSEAEQLSLYQECAHRNSARCDKMSTRIARQLAALTWLQQHYSLSSVPNGSDSIVQWMDARVAALLAKIGLLQLSQLIEHIRYFKHRWWIPIPGLGIVKAVRVENWLQLHANTIETEFNHDAARSDAHRLWRTKQGVQQPAATIVPLERLVIPAEISRRDAPLRAPSQHCLIAATCDVEALRVWLCAKDLKTMDAVPGWEMLRNMSHTQRAYWKEAERFFLWLVLVRSTTMSAISQVDCDQYAAFLKNPPGHWCAVRGRDKSDVSWRPFEAALSTVAGYRAMKVLRGMYDFLVARRYLLANPWADYLRDTTTGRPKVSQVPRQRARFDAVAWETIYLQLDRLSNTSANLRLSMAIHLLRDTGVSIGTLVRARIRNVDLGLADTTDGHIAIKPATAKLLQAYFKSRGLSDDLRAPGNADASLLGRATDVAVRAPWVPCAREPVDPKAGINIGTLRDQLKSFFLHCAQQCQDQPILAAQFRHATSHWLR